MGTELALPAGFGPLPAAFAGTGGTNEELGQGIAPSYGVMGYKGKVWSAKYQGNETPLMRDDGDGPRNSIEVVLIKASPAISKIFYRSGYVEGSTAAPDCWSGNGVTPDGSVQNKVHPTCADCPMNAWGSRVTESGKQGKSCADSRRVAIVPILDMDNEMFGGPMLLRVPAASLKDLKGYGDVLSSYQFPYYAVVTRIAFDPKEAFPKFVFSAVRPLTEAEAAKTLALREDRRVAAVLNETADITPAGNAPAAPPVPASPFEQAPAPAEAQAAPAAPVAPPAPVAAPVAPPAPVAAPAAPVAPPAPVAAPPAAAPANPFGGPVVAPATDPAPQAPVAQAPQAVAAPQQAPVPPAAAPAAGDAPSPSLDAFDAILEGVLQK